MLGIRIYLIIIFTLSMTLFMGSESWSTITGLCSTCHTMHNSQNGDPVVSLTYGAETNAAKEMLLVGSCMGCHAQGTANNIETLGTSEIPQVYHTNSTDLAGGNFRYILGGSSDNKGHNVKAFGETDTKSQPPGRRHDINALTGGFVGNFNCAGSMGCHGSRPGNRGELYSLEGAHHNNAGPELNTATTVANSYRFLKSVKGYENNGANIWENLNSTSHNEYFGRDGPTSYGCAGGSCHDNDMNVRPQYFTMSGFCATCHGYFHLLTSGGETGVGDDKNSPFLRHPTDVILPEATPDTEYESYTSYSVMAPVARTTVFASISSSVTPGADVVMCLSCHGSHATNYDDMLRWDYRNSTLADAIEGCAVCHTDKN